MPFTSYLETKVLNHVFRGQTFTAPTSLYVALFTSTGEVTGGGYARQQITFSAPVTEGDSSYISNDAEIRFPIAMADWGEITEAAIYDAETGGNQLDRVTLDVPRTVGENDQFVIAVDKHRIRIR